MPSVSKRGALVVALLTGLGLVTVGPAAASAAAPSDDGTTQNVIVVLHNQHDDLTITKGKQSARVDANRQDQSGAIDKARSHGAQNIHGFDTVNAFAATVTPAQQSAIAADPTVAAIYPDLPIRKAPGPDREKHPGGTTKPTPAVNSAVCPTDPAKPFLEPEALQLTNTAFLDPATPQAQNLYTGTGVKVAFLADGLDINNQDFIRADGSHVFVDYQDFSGDGTNAPSGAAEAFGDASSIAAQGLHTYDIVDFAPNSAAAQPSCTITIRGMAPGASLVGLKVFGNAPTAPTSRFIQAIDYAVNTAGVDVINESFGGNPFPDNGNDPITLADNAAVDAGITVVASTGDAGTTNTIGSPSSAAKIIGVAATTSFRSYQQETASGAQLSNGTWISNNISSLSSGGITQSGRVPDLAAPGDLGWALCTPDLELYEECTNNNGDPSPIQNFGGTSQSSPLVAGAAALVIQAYESTHHGVRPAPALVKRLLTSTAQDLGHPAYEQGAGLLNSLAAVKAAASWADSTAKPRVQGAALVVNKTQLSPQGFPGTVQFQALSVRNVSNRTQVVRSTARTLGTPVSAAFGAVTLNTATAPTYTDQIGVLRSYVEQDFTIPANKDRLDVSLAATLPAGFAPRVILVDPTGAYAAYSIPQGAGNYGHVDVRYPKGGVWKAFFAASKSSGFNGPIQYSATTENYTTAGVATPVVIPAGGTRTVFVAARLPSQPGDVSASVQLTTASGLVTSVPMTLRSIVPPRDTTFTGVFTGGNGRQAFPQQSQVYYVDVPRGRKDLGIGITWNDPNQTFVGVLTAPDGQVYSAQSNADVDAAGNDVSGNAFQMYRRNPAPGRWTLSVFTGVVSGQELQQPFTVKVAYNTVKVSANLPTNARTALTAGQPVQVPVKITNTGVAPQTYFADGRLDTVGDLPLAELSGVDQPIPLPVPAGVTPQWLVPTETRKQTFVATADQPVNLDVFAQLGEPELYSAAIGNGATVNVNAAQVTPGIWAADIGQSGPFGDGGAPAGTVSVSATARAQLFDPNVTSNAAGDIWQAGLATATPDPATVARVRAGAAVRAKSGVASSVPAVAAAVTSAQASTGQATSGPGPVYLQPGEDTTITVTITPSGAKGSVVTGHLYIDNFNFFLADGDELIDLPYTYSIK